MNSPIVNQALVDQVAEQVYERNGTKLRADLARWMLGILATVIIFSCMAGMHWQSIQARITALEQAELRRASEWREKSKEDDRRHEELIQRLARMEAKIK